MKKTIAMLLISICLVLAGCGGSAKADYDAADELASDVDSYQKEISVFNPVEGGYQLTVTKYNGRQTLWTSDVEENTEIEVSFELMLLEGQVKIVLVDGDDNVTTLLECTPDTCASDPVTIPITLTKGRNKIKVVGYDCKNLKLVMLSPSFQ